MRRLPLIVCALALCAAAGLVLAQQPTFSTQGVQVVPASAVNGAGVVGSPQELFQDGSQTAPSIGWASDADGSGTGLYRATANDVSITNNGARIYAFNATSFNLLGVNPTIVWGATTVANLGTATAGTQRYCSACAPTTAATCPATKASCVCTSGGVGSWAYATNALWYCPF